MSRAATEQTNIEEMLYMRGELSTREQVSGIRKSVESATNLATLLWCVKVDPMENMLSNQLNYTVQNEEITK